MTTIAEPAEVTENGVKSLACLQRLLVGTHTKTEFWNLQAYVVRTSRPILLRNKFSHEQGSAWNTFVERVVAKYPNLGQYDNVWPIRVAWDRRVAGIRSGPRRKSTKSPLLSPRSGTSVRATGGGSAFLPSSSRKRVPTMSRNPSRRMFVGKPPPDLKISTSSTPSPVTKAPTIIVIDDSDDEMGDTPPSTSSSWPQASNLRKPWPLIPSQFSADVVCVGCLECGRPPPRELVGVNTFIQAMVGYNPEYFLGWSYQRRRAFLEDLETSSFIKQALVHLLLQPSDGEASGAEDSRTVTPPLPTPTRVFSGLLQPDADAEEEITNPNNSIDLLVEAMHLGGNRELFEEVSTLVWALGRAYISTYRPTKEKFESTVKRISASKLLFERYENNWPIRFILKRLARKSGCKPGDGHLDRTSAQGSSIVKTVSSNSSNSFSSLSSKEKGLSSPSKPGSSFPTRSTGDVTAALPWIQYTCPVHPGVDVNAVSDNVKRSLHVRGLADLIPLFALVGIRSQIDLQQFCAFSDQEKDAVFGRPMGRRVKLNLFQKLLLKLEFTI